ncbi:MAG: hypothetical protein WDN31_23315 [Hyphomicrobium sp.]
MRQNWRLLVAAGLAAFAVSKVIDISDRQGRFDIPSGYAVRMTCEPDPESALWSGGCDRIAADIARRDKPSFIELYRAFITAHHAHIPSPATQRRFAGMACDPQFDVDTLLKGTRFVFIPLRAHFAGVCAAAHARAIMEEIDARDRALLAIEREGLSQEALFAGALANLTEPLVILAVCGVAAALLLL